MMRPVLYLFFLMALPMTTIADEFTPVSFDDVLAYPQPEVPEPIAYGEHALQIGELRLPEGDGPFPVITVIHGGCWLAAYDRGYMRPLAAALTEAGFATWLIAYRRIGDEGGGWPNTFLDVAKGFDHVRELAKEHPLDLERVASLGHSAGGHLALWLAQRAVLPQGGELYKEQALIPDLSVGLAAIADTIGYASGAGTCNEQTPKLFGGMPDEQAVRYQQGSPYAAVPLPGHQLLVHGEQDPIVPVSQSQDFALNSLGEGGTADLITVNRAGHFDVVLPEGASWALLLAALQKHLNAGE